MKTARVSPARAAALEALMRAESPRAPGVDALLEENLPPDVSSADRALAREIAYSVLRHCLWIKHTLKEFLHKPLSDRRVEAILYMTLAQHVILDRIPPHAIVSESVELAAAHSSASKAKGLVNAVARKITARAPESFERDDWALWESVPGWMRTEAGLVLPDQEHRVFFESLNRRAPLCLRPRGDVPEELRARARPGRLVPECLVLEDGTANPAALAGFAEGLITAEDEGAQAAALLAGPDSDARLVLDLCAAPGGKTAHMADRLAPEARLIATDVSQKKLDRMQNTLERLGLTRRVNTGLAPEVLRDVEPETFDHVLVDAPCSGLGTLRRHPEARYRRSPESIRGNAQDQVRLLRSVVPLVRTGGTIGYSVCTWTREEGEDAAARFLEAEPRFERAEAPEDAPGLAEKCATGNGYWRTWTHRHGCDAFFVARFRRRE